MSKKLSEEHKRKISEALKGRISWAKGKHFSEEHRRKISEGLKKNPPMLGKHHTKDARQKMSEAKKGQIPWIKGKHHTIETRKRISKKMKGRVPWHKGKHFVHSKSFQKGHVPWNKGKKNCYSEEVRMQMSKSHKNLRLSEEHKRRISKSLKGKSNSGSFKKGHIPWSKGLKGVQTAWNKGIPCSEETKRKIKRTMSKNPQAGYRGTKKHQKFVKRIANLLNNEVSKVEIEKTVKLTPQCWRIIDILVDGNLCFEIGACEKSKIKELTEYGFEVIHLPYSLLE